METPKSKSWKVARYVVFTAKSNEPVIARWDYKEKSFKQRKSFYSNGCGSWLEWATLHSVVGWMRVDKKENFTTIN